MPNTKSAKKALRQNMKRYKRNMFYKALYRELRKKFLEAIKHQDLTKAREIFYNTKENGITKRSGLHSMIDKLAKKHIIHKNNANRKKRKFMLMMKNLEASLSH